MSGPLSGIMAPDLSRALASPHTRDFPVEGINRDLRIMRICEGSLEIQRIIISGNMLA